MVRLSKSAVLTYLQCPYKYKLQYIDKTQVVDTAALAKGKEVHKLIEDFFAHKVEIADAKENVLSSLEGKKHKKAVDNIEKFAKDMSPDGKTLWMPLLQEVKMYNEELNFSGIVDAVFLQENDIIVVDWKTGQIHDLENYRFELSMYKYLFECENNMKITHWGIYFVDHNKFVVEEASIQVMRDSVQVVQNVRKLIVLGRFPKKTSEACSYCQYFKAKKCNGINGA